MQKMRSIVCECAERQRALWGCECKLGEEVEHGWTSLYAVWWGLADRVEGPGQDRKSTNTVRVATTNTCNIPGSVNVHGILSSLATSASMSMEGCLSSVASSMEREAPALKRGATCLEVVSGRPVNAGSLQRTYAKRFPPEQRERPHIHT